MSEVHNHVESHPIPVLLRRQLLDCTCSGGCSVIPLKFIAVPRNVDPYYNVPPRGSFGPWGRYYSGQWSEDDYESRLTMRPDAEYVWPSPPYFQPYFAPFPHISNEISVDPYYNVPPPNDFVPLSRYYPGEWMDVEHLSCFARNPEGELVWTPPPCLPPPIAFPINSEIIVEESDEDVVLIQPNPNWFPCRCPKGLQGLQYVHRDVCTCRTILPTPLRYAPWIPDDSTVEEHYSMMHCCDCCEP